MPAVKGRWALELTGYKKARMPEEYTATMYFKKEEARDFLVEVRRLYAGWRKLNVWLIPPKGQNGKEKLL